MGGKRGSDGCGNATAHVPDRHHAQASRLEVGDQVVEYAVSNIFVKDAFVAEAPQVQLQTLQLQNVGSGHIVDREGGEVGLPSHRTDAGELGTDALDLVLTPRMRISYKYQVLRRGRRHRR